MLLLLAAAVRQTPKFWVAKLGQMLGDGRSEGMATKAPGKALMLTYADCCWCCCGGVCTWPGFKCVAGVINVDEFNGNKGIGPEDCGAALFGVKVELGQVIGWTIVGVMGTVLPLCWVWFGDLESSVTNFGSLRTGFTLQGAGAMRTGWWSTGRLVKTLFFLRGLYALFMTTFSTVSAVFEGGTDNVIEGVVETDEISEFVFAFLAGGAMIDMLAGDLISSLISFADELVSMISSDISVLTWDGESVLFLEVETLSLQFSVLITAGNDDFTVDVSVAKEGSGLWIRVELGQEGR